MRRVSASCLLLALAGAACSASHLADGPRPDWPVAPPADTPKDIPAPASTLTGGDWFVVQSDEEVMVLASPPGIVSVTEEAGPIRLRGTFADGKRGVVETRVYAKKHVFIVERLVDVDGNYIPGRVELLAVPRGKVERRLVTDGTAPIPPPKPKPPGPIIPDPVVPEPDSLLVAKFKSALKADIDAGQGTKAHAANLAVVFESGAALLDLNDPAIMPKTVGELLTKQINASVAKQVPRPPYLKNVRGVIEMHTPLRSGLAELTPELKKEYQAAYRLVAAALAEAAK